MTNPDDLVARIAELEGELAMAREASAAAFREAGAARAEVQVLRDELAAARAAQSEWDELIGHIERERAVAADVAAELDAVKGSTTWKVGTVAMSPYRWVESRRRPDDG